MYFSWEFLHFNCVFDSIWPHAQKSISLPLSRSVSSCLSLCLSLCISVCLSLSLSVSLCFSLSLFVSLCLSLSPFISLCPSLSLYPSLSVSLCLTLCPSLRLVLSVSLCLSLSPLCLPLSVCLRRCFSIFKYMKIVFHIFPKIIIVIFTKNQLAWINEITNVIFRPPHTDFEMIPRSRLRRNLRHKKHKGRNRTRHNENKTRIANQSQRYHMNYIERGHAFLDPINLNSLYIVFRANDIPDISRQFSPHSSNLNKNTKLCHHSIRNLK